MDEVEKVADRALVRQLEAYFTNTGTGRYRTQWIVPSPFFVASDMIYAMQAADICIYCVNWGFRIPSRGMNAPTRSGDCGRVRAVAQPIAVSRTRLSRSHRIRELRHLLRPQSLRSGPRIKKEVKQSGPPESNPSAEPPI